MDVPLTPPPGGPQSVLKLRKSLLGIFAYVAAVFAFASLGTVQHLFSFAHTANEFPDRNLSPAIVLWSHVLVALGELILVIPPFIAFFYGMAWWKIRKGRPSGRGWAIAASAFMLLQAVPLSVVTYYTAVYAARRSGGWSVFALIDCAMLALGAVGLAAFLPRTAMEAPVAPARPPRVSGDGTSGILDSLAWLFVVAGYWLGWSWLEKWAAAQGIPFSMGLGYWVQFLVAALIDTALHEAGHASAALALGMKLRAFVVGPFQWRIRAGRWRFQLAPTRMFGAGGATGVVPTDPRQARWREVCMIAAGPVASLITGVVALAAALTAVGRPYQAYWQFLALLGLFGLLAFCANLIPMRPEGFYSDGARIYQLLSGGPWADLSRATSLAGATLVTALRPRDYDIAVIERASQRFTHGGQALWLRLLASSHYLDCGDRARARQAVADAEAIYRNSAPDLPAGLYAVLVFDAAYIARDRARAREWWESMEAKAPHDFEVDYWLAKAALEWIEGRGGEARQSLLHAEEETQKLPAAGAYEFDRSRCALLKQALAEQPAEEEMPVAAAK